MTFKSNIGPSARTIYVGSGGRDEEDGHSLETAKRTIQAAVTAINALIPAPGENNRASIIIDGTNNFEENIVFPPYTDVAAINTKNEVTVGNAYQLNTGSHYNFRSVVVDIPSSNALVINGSNDIQLNAGIVKAAANLTVGLAITGSSSNLIVNCNKITSNSTESIGIYFNGSSTTANVFNFSEIVIRGIDADGIAFNPTDSASTAIINGGSIILKDSPTGTTAIRIVDGNVYSQIDNIESDIRVEGGNYTLIANNITGDIFVSVGATLNCQCNNHTGVVTGQDINGRIGETTYGNYNDLQNISVPVPSGTKTTLTYSGGQYTWDEVSSDGYETVAAISTDPPFDIQPGQSVEYALNGTNGFINFPTANGATANIKLKTLHLIGANNLTHTAFAGENFQFIDENGISQFDTTIETSVNRPIVFEPDVTRWRMFL